MGNDPINNADPSGGFSVPGALIGSGTGFVLGMAYGFFHNNDGGSMLKDGLIGAAIGAAAGGFSGDLFGGAGGAGNASISNVLNAVNSKAANIASIAVHAANGAAQMTGNFGVDNAYREQSFDGFNAEVISHGGGGSEAPDQFSNNENNGPGPRIPFLGPIIIKPGSPIWNFLTRISPFTPFEELLLGRDVGENFGQKISRKNILKHLASNPLAFISTEDGFGLFNFEFKEGETVVLGHYPAYTDLAEELKANSFQVPLEEWNKLNSKQQWDLNQKFLDEAIKNNAKFRLATPLDKIKQGSAYAKELKYLESKGYYLAPDGLWMIKGPMHYY